MGGRTGSGLRLAAASLALGLLPVGGGAVPFPQRVVRILDPYPVSGPPDIRGAVRSGKAYRLIARSASPPLSETLARIAARAIASASRHGAVVEPQPGAVTTRAVGTLLRSPPDGHTLLLASNATLVIVPSFFHGVRYRAADLELVAPLAKMPYLLVAAPRVPAGSLAELLAWLRRRPGEVNFGSPGDGSTGHLAGELFRRMAGVSIVHVSYNGGLAALGALASGQVSVAFVALPVVLAHLRGGSVRALALCSAQRSPLLPELPTVAESGLPGYEVEAWFALFGRAGIPAAARVWYAERLARAISAPETGDRLHRLGLEPATEPAGRFATRMHSEAERLGPIMRAARLPARASRSQSIAPLSAAHRAA